MNRKSYLLKLQSNIAKNYVFLGLSYVDLTCGLWMIWLTILSLNLTHLGILKGTFHLTKFLMEVPTEIIAELFGRKTSRIHNQSGCRWILYI